MRINSRVYVVDDDPAARESVCAMVEAMGLEAESFECAEDFLAVYDERWAGCVVSDLRMTGMSGLDLLERVARREIRLPVIIVTAYANVSVAVRAMQTGAVTLLEKPCGKQELWNAISDAIERDAVGRQEAEMLRDIRERLAKLSPDEQNVLALIVDGIANKTIASRLNVSLRTVESRRRSVFQKMGTESLAELVRLVYHEQDARRGQAPSQTTP